MKELGMHHVTAKFVPRNLTTDQKQQCVNVCTELHQLASDDETYLSRVITGDESCVYGYDPETKQQSSQWKSPKSPRPKKARQVKSNVKSMIITFFDVKGIVHKEYVPTGQTVNSGFNCDILWRMNENVWRCHPKLWREQTCLLHHDNAPSYTSILTQQFLAKNKMAVIPWFGTLWLLPISKNETEAERTPVWCQWGDTGRIAESARHSDRKRLPGSVPKMKKTVGPVSTCRRELFRGWRRPISIMVSFTIFTMSVRKILDTTSYILMFINTVIKWICLLSWETYWHPSFIINMTIQHKTLHSRLNISLFSSLYGEIPLGLFLHLHPYQLHQSFPVKTETCLNVLWPFSYSYSRSVRNFPETWRLKVILYTGSPDIYINKLHRKIFARIFPLLHIHQRFFEKLQMLAVIIDHHTTVTSTSVTLICRKP